MESALSRLDEELRTATTALERGRRRMEQMRDQGPSEELTALEELGANAKNAIETARNAKTFEDALRYLRDANNVLTRI